eukprot:jgi/Tetstr1/461519/TSEL_006625.t1
MSVPARPRADHGAEGAGPVTGAVLSTSLCPANRGDRQWRVTARKVADRQRPNLALPEVLHQSTHLANLPCSCRGSARPEALCDAAAKLARLPFLACLPQGVAVELLRWGELRAVAEGEEVASPATADASGAPLQVVLSGSAIAEWMPPPEPKPEPAQGALLSSVIGLLRSSVGAVPAGSASMPGAALAETDPAVERSTGSDSASAAGKEDAAAAGQ